MPYVRLLLFICCLTSPTQRLVSLNQEPGPKPRSFKICPAATTNMRSPSPLSLLAPLSISTAVSARGIIKVINTCTFPVSYSLADNRGITDFVGFIGENGGIYNEVQNVYGGRAIKLATDANALPVGSPVVQFEYTVSQGTIYYSISTVTGCPPELSGLELLADDPRCDVLSIGGGSQSPTGAGTVVTCSEEATLALFLCGAPGNGEVRRNETSHSTIRI